MNISKPSQLNTLAELIKQWGAEQGFAQVGISDIDLSTHQHHLQQWLDQQHHGEMSYMQRNQALRNNPEQLQDGALRSISFRMEYRHNSADMENILTQSNKAYISRYALGRDYHKLIRKRLANIAQKISDHSQLNLNQRAFVDSAPVLERALAEKSGLGWIGKNTMLINPKAGSWFFLGEILTDLALPTDPVEPSHHCGSCTACLDACPTNAFVGANQLDARKCISYLTIEYKGSIPTELRP
ncbi:MAG: tRNA epoxyqueuosine(34) reductase QueG, partial [Sinobacterium sp.]|nr:tRNA epoxyqueuosine(34) reductase QueG [Sinobacterium sp.]